MQASLLEHSAAVAPGVCGDIIDLDGVQLTVVDETAEDDDRLVVAGWDC